MTFKIKSVVTTVLTVWLLSIVIASPAYSNQSTWQRYQSKGFSVILPEAPTTLDVLLPSKFDEAKRTGWLFTAYEDKVVYVVLVCPRRGDRLSRFISEVEKYNTEAKAQNFDHDFSGSGFTGKQYSFVNSQGFSGIVRFYETKSKVFVVQAHGEKVDTPSVKQFFESFAVTDDEMANSVVYTDADLTRSDQEADAARSETFKGKELSTKPRVLIKPEPMYSEAARQNQVTGRVVLRSIFAANGRVIALQVVKKLPDGLTDRAILAARSVRFIPGTKDGRVVNMYVQLEYNFNLY